MAGRSVRDAQITAYRQMSAADSMSVQGSPVPVTLTFPASYDSVTLISYHEESIAQIPPPKCDRNAPCLASERPKFA